MLHCMSPFVNLGQRLSILSIAIRYDKHLKGKTVTHVPEIDSQTDPMVLSEFADGSGHLRLQPKIERMCSTWPPKSQMVSLYLHPGGGLYSRPVGDDQALERSCYTYDPDDPTPNLGGPTFSYSMRGGQMDQRALEARQDVVLFSSDQPLRECVKVAGVPEAEIYFRTSAKVECFFYHCLAFVWLNRLQATHLNRTLRSCKWALCI